MKGDGVLKRIYTQKISIDPESLKEFYKKRAREKSSIDVDAPVVLVGDKDKSKIEEWTRYERVRWLPELHLDENSVVLEVGCGTGRITKYITNEVKAYLGIDYVQEFIDLIQSREDIQKNANTYFVHSSVQDLVDGSIHIPIQDKFNRFVISGGVFMYINDIEVENILNLLLNLLDDECIVYISEPIALEQRLTLNRFYSEDLQNEYSAIYRTEQEYTFLFKVFLERSFTLDISEEFFSDDIKAQKETKQWMFVLRRKNKV